MSFFDNLPILAAFAIAAPEIFAAEAVGGEAVAAGSSEAAAAEASRLAAEEAARQEAARVAAEEAARQAALQSANQGILQAGTEFTGILPQGYAPGQVEAMTQGAGQGINVAGPMQVPPPAGLNQTGIVQSGDLTGVNPYPNLQGGQTYGQFGEVTGGPPAGNADRAIMNSNMGYQGSDLPIPSNSPVVPESSALKSGFDSFSKFAETYPRSTAALGYVGAYNLGLLDPRNSNNPDRPYNGPLNRYRMSPNFQGSTANPQNYQYSPRYAEGGILYAGGGPVEAMSNANAIGANTGYPMADINKAAYSAPYQTPVAQNVVQGDTDIGVNPMTGEQNFAEGGIASYAKGGNLSNSLEYYTDMMDGTSNRRALPERSDVGIYRDTDPDTMYLDPLSAAQVRMAKLNKRANMQLPNMKRPTPMGQLNLRPQGSKAESGSSPDTEYAAHGGIMQANGHLGGYAAGGNARLLKGPGDGMSDNIPATIAGRQPARLADGEFVVPADVVSHLGNGSTDAGAKKLHQMMTNVREARTGNPKQGKQINPNKFTPK
jgi:hypothetical protein